MKQLQFLFFALLSAGILILLSSCRKERDQPKISISHLNTTWETGSGDNYQELLFQGKSSCYEQLPQQGVTPDQQEIGKVYRWYTKVIHIPLLPDVKEKYKDSGIFYVTYASMVDDYTIVLEGTIDWTNRQLYVGQNLTSVGDPAGVRVAYLQWDIRDSSSLTYNSTPFTKQ